MPSEYEEKIKSGMNIEEQAKELAYGKALDVFNNTQRIGNYILTSFNLQVLNDKYTEDGNFVSDKVYTLAIIDYVYFSYYFRNYRTSEYTDTLLEVCL